MRVAAGRIVTIDYQVRLETGEIVEGTESANPVQYLHGAGMLLPSLELALDHLEEGTHSRFIIDARHAYGVRDETSVVTLPRSIFPNTVDLTVGARLAARTAGGEAYPLTVREIFQDRVLVDLNHPLAGKDLHFEVTIRSVRAAGTEEVFTGKPHPVEIV